MNAIGCLTEVINEVKVMINLIGPDHPVAAWWRKMTEVDKVKEVKGCAPSY